MAWLTLYKVIYALVDTDNLLNIWHFILSSDQRNQSQISIKSTIRMYMFFIVYLDF